MKYKIIKERNLKTSELLNLCRDKFKVWSYWSDKELDKDFPIPRVLTKRKFKDTVEADKNLKNISANNLKKKGIEGITLRERIIWELEYFEKTGKHLDIDNITLCSGSRDFAGDVPHAYWSSDYGRFYVYWSFPYYSDDNRRSRAVVS